MRKKRKGWEKPIERKEKIGGKRNKRTEKLRGKRKWQKKENKRNEKNESYRKASRRKPRILKCRAGHATIYCRDNETMFSGHKVICYCNITIFGVARHRDLNIS